MLSRTAKIAVAVVIAVVVGATVVLAAANVHLFRGVFPFHIFHFILRIA